MPGFPGLADEAGPGVERDGMPRDIPVGNGELLVNFDQHYQIRDIYFPHVGQENHGGQPCRFGAWGKIHDPARAPAASLEPDGEGRHGVFWTHEGWSIAQAYCADTLTTDVRLKHPSLKIELHCNDVADFHRPLLVRRIEVTNLLDQPRQIRLFHQNNFMMYGARVGDTAYFDPQMRCLIHYRLNRYLMAGWHADGEQRVDEYATGATDRPGAEGTWRDAEDGSLGNNAIAQGAVDSTMMVIVRLPPLGKQVVYMYVGAARTHTEARELHRFLAREGPQGVIDRTNAYWKLWLREARVTFPHPDQAGPSQKVVDLFKRSLLVVRSQIDNGGAIIAANDSDIMQYNRDTYSYLWPRDGALVAAALDAAGFHAITRRFYRFCGGLIEDRGYFLHKYNPNGSPASSWHPWVRDGKPQLPIQQDETALVVWSLWRHYHQCRDIEFVRPLWNSLITKAADFLVRYRDPHTKLPLPSYDLWEERWGVHAYTVATVYAGLRGAENFAKCFGDHRRAERYNKAAKEVQEAFCQYFWSSEHQRFYRRIEPKSHDRVSAMTTQVMAGRTPRDGIRPRVAGVARAVSQVEHLSPENLAEQYHLDPTIDASMYAIFAFDLLPPGDERVVKTMDAIESKLWVKTSVGGLARYERDDYQRVAWSPRDYDTIPGNPWFICTLWLAEWRIARAKTLEDLKPAAELFDWVADHALPSGVLAEQVHPHTNEPLSVSPLTWSHAAVVYALMRYLGKVEELAALGRMQLPAAWA